MEKVVRNGMVAVLISPGYGAGWTTWFSDDVLEENALFDPNLVALLESGASMERIVKYAEEAYPDQYHGSESIERRDEIKWRIA